MKNTLKPCFAGPVRSPLYPPTPLCPIMTRKTETSASSARRMTATDSAADPICRLHMAGEFYMAAA